MGLKGGRGAGGKVVTCVVLLLLAARPALAQYEDEPLPGWYAGPMVGYAFADTDRNVSDAPSLHLVAGKVFHDAFAVELNLFATSFDADTGGADTDILGGGADLALGLAAPGHPVFLLGAGMAQQDVGGESKATPFAHFGLGYYLPFSFGSELWRVEARYHLLLGEHPALPGQDSVEDVRLTLGVLFAFGGKDAAPPPAPPPPAAPDADGDGVPDGRDECAETPSWVRVEPNGCPPDFDQDGVADASDACPGTPPGTQVDTRGCALAPALAIAPLDEDADGVADADDACRGTSAGVKVDARGCALPEALTLRSAYFGSGSSSLTARGYALLGDVAAALRADPAMRLEVEGHADSSGSTGLNQRLSQQRADVARGVLVDLGIAPARLVARGYGATQPVNDNSTLELRASNRRVNFRRLDQATR